MRAFARPPAARVVGRRQPARNSTRCACAISRPGTDLADVVPDVAGSPVWTADSSAFYYVRLDENHRPSRVYRHRLGTPASDDALVYEEPDSRFFVGARQDAVRPLRRHLGARPRDVGMLAARSRPIADAKPRAGRGARRPACSTTSSIIRTGRGEEVLVLRTNADGAEDFKIVVTPLASAGREHWRDLVPHRRGVYRARHSRCCADWLVRLRARGRPAAHRRAPPRRAARSTRSTFAEEAYSLGADGGYEFATDTLRFHYSSMTTPNEVWDYDLKTRARTLRKRQEVPSGHDPVGLRDAPPAGARPPDGETVPVSILHRRDIEARRQRALPALRLWRLRHAMPAVVQRPAGSRWSIAASSTRSRMSAAAPRRAGAGTGRQARQEAEHVRGFHRGGRASARRSGYAAPARSSRMAARPAAC